MRPSTVVLSAIAASYIGACTPVPIQSDPFASDAGRKSDVLTWQEIESVHVGNALEALQLLRRNMLVSARVSTPDRVPKVYIDNDPFPYTPEDLSMVMAASIVDVRYLSAMNATIRFRGGHQTGAILVTTLASRPRGRP